MLVLSWLKQCLNSAWHIRHENLKPQDVQGTWNQRVAPSLRVPGKPWYCPLTFPQKHVGTRAEVNSRWLGRLCVSHGKCPCQARRLTVSSAEGWTADWETSRFISELQ